MTPTITFSHPVFNELYQKDYFIDEAVLREIIALGSDVAAPELLKIVDDTLASFNLEEHGEDWYHTFYFLHALYLLDELEAYETLDVCLRILRRDDAFWEYWFGDYIYEELPELVARAGRDELSACMAAVEDGTYSLEARMIVAQALLRIVAWQPQKRPLIMDFFRRYLQKIIAQAQAGQLEEAFPADDDQPYGYDVHTYLGFLLAELQEHNATGLTEEIRQLHRLGVVDESIAGGEQDLDFRQANVPRPPSIFARYRTLREGTGEDSPFNPDAEAVRARKALEKQKRRRNADAAAVSQALAAPKPGRNDPCPCGSGQKYKKCCME